MATNSQPLNTNFLSNVGAKFMIKKIPNVNYFIQNVAVPSVDVGGIEVVTPFSNRIKYPGDLVTYGDLVITRFLMILNYYWFSYYDVRIFKNLLMNIFLLFFVW